jgi:predicted enzyme related to lactoylglutathione lyase
MSVPSTATSAGATITGLELTYCVVSDAARSIAFYRDILGLKPTMENESGAEFELADGATFGVWNPGGGDVKPLAGVMFAVADAQAAVAAIRARGGTIGDVTESPVCYMAFGTDPDGIAYCIHQRK